MELTPRLPVVYIAGPYRAATKAGIMLNIQAARSMGLQAIRRGWSPIIPHSNFGLLDLVDPSIGDAFWLAATMEHMRRADSVLLVPGWQNSTGTQAEVREAERMGLPIYRTLDEMPDGAEHGPFCIEAGVGVLRKIFASYGGADAALAKTSPMQQIVSAAAFRIRDLEERLREAERAVVMAGSDA